MVPDCFLFRRETTKKTATIARITTPATVTPTTGPVLLDPDDFAGLGFLEGVEELGARFDGVGGGGFCEVIEVGGLASFDGIGFEVEGVGLGMDGVRLGMDGVGVAIGVGGVGVIMGWSGGGMLTGGGNDKGGEMTVTGGTGKASAGGGGEGGGGDGGGRGGGGG